MVPKDEGRSTGSQNEGRSTGSQNVGGSTGSQTGRSTGSSSGGGSTGSANVERTTGTTHTTSSQADRGNSGNRTSRRSQDSNSGSGGDILSNINLNKGTLLGALGALAGGALLFRGLKGSWPFSGGTGSAPKIVDLSTKQTINKSREELYAYWRNLDNLPNFMSHLEEVRELDDKRSTWTAKIPGGLGTVEWDAEIVRERTNHLLAWRSLPGAEIENAGEVRFETAPGGKGTVVETTISYRPPAGELGGYAAKLFNPAFEKTVKTDLQEFKKYMEKGGKPKRKSTPSSKA